VRTDLDQHESLYAVMNTVLAPHPLIAKAAALIMVGCLGSTLVAAQTPTAPPALAVAPYAPASQLHFGQGLGRLLTTESERTALDAQRFNTAPPPPPKRIVEAGPPQLHINGVTMRPDRPPGQRVTVWIDGHAYLENALPPGLQLVKNTRGEVTGMTSKTGKNKTEFAPIGNMISRPQTPEEAEAEKQAAQEALKAATALKTNSTVLQDKMKPQ
jgi:hypothetical protein